MDTSLSAPVFRCSSTEIREVIQYDCPGVLEVTHVYDDGECVNDADGDGICDEFEVIGCMEEDVCNYDPKQLITRADVITAVTDVQMSFHVISTLKRRWTMALVSTLLVLVVRTQLRVTSIWKLGLTTELVST